MWIVPKTDLIKGYKKPVEDIDIQESTRQIEEYITYSFMIPELYFGNKLMLKCAYCQSYIEGYIGDHCSHCGAPIE
jgi:hypothetical protein